MGGLNRGRLAVQLGGNWRLYALTVPAGCKVLGVVHRGCEAGALVLTGAGVYAMLNAGVLTALDQRKVLAALALAEPKDAE